MPGAAVTQIPLPLDSMGPPTYSLTAIGQPVANFVFVTLI